MWNYLNGHRVLIVFFALLVVLESIGFWIDYKREQQLEARSEIIVLAITSRLEKNRPLTCAETEEIKRLWTQAGFDKAKAWNEISNGCE